MRRSHPIALLGLPSALLLGCATERGPTAADRAKVEMVGLSRERVLACMGSPKDNNTIGGTEVWGYYSTDRKSTRLNSSHRL